MENYGSTSSANQLHIKNLFVVLTTACEEYMDHMVAFLVLEKCTWGKHGNAFSANILFRHCCFLGGSPLPCILFRALILDILLQYIGILGYR